MRSPCGKGRIAIDDFLTINEQDKAVGGICRRVEGQQYIGSCFGQVRTPGLPPAAYADKPMSDVFGLIGPVDVSGTLSSGQVGFELWDAGTIRGNTDLWLVIVDKGCLGMKPPRSKLRGIKRKISS